MIIHHAILQGCNCFLAYEIAQYFVGVWKGSSRTFARNHVAILLEEGSGVFGVLAEILLETWIAGSLLTLQDACACQNHRSSADGTNSLACLVLCDERLAHTLVLVQVGAAWHSAWEKQHVGILKTGYILKLQVSLQGDAMCGFHPFTTPLRRMSTGANPSISSKPLARNSYTFAIIFIFLSYYSINIITFAKVRIIIEITK